MSGDTDAMVGASAEPCTVCSTLEAQAIEPEAACFASEPSSSLKEVEKSFKDVRVASSSSRKPCTPLICSEATLTTGISGSGGGSCVAEFACFMVFSLSHSTSFSASRIRSIITSASLSDS